MIRFSRPSQPPELKKRAKAKLELVCGAMEQGGSPRWGDRPFWSKPAVKETYRKAQHGKCGYCERKPESTGTVDHYRPKGRITRLIDVETRAVSEDSKIGFWWLAFEWDNFIFACTDCNRDAKASLFPVRESPRPVIPRSLDQGKAYRDTPLLLNPYSLLNPSAHFFFSDLGGVEGITPEGIGTVQTCNLNSKRLAAAREGVAGRAHGAAERFCMPQSEEMRQSAMLELYELGLEDRVGAGMVRVIFEQIAEIAWEELSAAAVVLQG